MSDRQIAIFGGGSWERSDPHWHLAAAVGRLAAEHGFQVVTGGYGGVMEGASHGAREAGGEPAGVLHLPPDAEPPNEYVTHRVLADDYLDRMAILLRVPVAVALPGRSGTLAEIAGGVAMLHRDPDRQLLIWSPWWRDKLAEVFAGIGEPLNGLLWADSLEDVERWLDTMELPGQE